ncbi:class I adenylate-forming enzyme family protein [Cupriavidus numazuensis]|nr:class I adenylate-forming enzyme family protein [Cupriavidus numazuensis]
MKFASFLAAHAKMHGHKEAIICEGRRLSFRELEASTNRIARGLRSAGVQVGDRVVVYLPNGVEFVQAFIAAIKAGALAVPVNLPLSAPEIAHILGDATPKAAFICGTTQTTFARAASGLPAVVRIGTDQHCDADLRMDELAAEGDDSPLDVPHDAIDCMVGYTSGTTGRAKGVVLTQSNYLYVNGYLNGWHWGLTGDDRHLCTTPLAHRTGMARLMNVIFHGSTLVIMPRFDAAEATRLMRQERITVLGMVPTVGRMLLDEVESSPESFSSVRVALVTGEAFPLDVKKRLYAALPNVRFYSFYAMTEAGAIAGLDSSEQLTYPSSVGRIWPGVEVKLVDNRGFEVATGEGGEIWVRSGPPGLYSTMREYFRRPEDTAKTLHDGWVATGDMGRFDAEGYLYLMDRKKDMILSGGYNIYSKEVESAIQEYPGIRDVAVIGVPDSMFGEAVAAYVEAEEGVEMSAQAVIDHCRELIAGYKKPKYVFFVKTLPRNSTGKVLKTALREQYRVEHPGH